MEKRLRIASYNLHKGLSTFNRRVVLHDIRQALHELQPDLVFLQEVQGHNTRRELRHLEWPRRPQHVFLSAEGDYAVYGRNADYEAGHHGNALISRFPIRNWANHDLTLHRLEQRGLLHCEIAVPGWRLPLHAFCVHLNLLSRDRRRQLSQLVALIHATADVRAPLILAGDFNDWRKEASQILRQELGLLEAFETLYGNNAVSFPARMPMLALDRIYTRGFGVDVASVLTCAPWIGLSDHAPLFAILHRFEGS